MSLDKRTSVLLAVGTAAAGAGLAYYIYKRSMRSTDVLLTLQIEAVHVSWLEQIASSHFGGDQARAVQAMVQHCITASADDSVAKNIFQDKRCNTCGKKEKVNYVVSLTSAQVEFMDSIASKYSITKGRDKAMRVMFEYAMNDVDENVVFSS